MNTLASHAASLVERARVGDQNAMGMLVMVGRASRKGNPKAKRAFLLIQDYIKKHPPSGRFGAEKPTMPVGLVQALHTLKGKQLVNAVQHATKCKNGIQIACVIIAERAALNDARIDAISSEFGSEDEAKIFCYGVYNPGANANREIRKTLSSAGNQWLDIGRCFGYARAMQIVRLPRTRISRFDSMVGWELGE